MILRQQAQCLGDRLGNHPGIGTNSRQQVAALLRACRRDCAHRANHRAELLHATDVRGNVRQTLGHEAFDPAWRATSSDRVCFSLAMSTVAN